MFKLLNGLYYSEHQLALNHDKILQEVIMAKVKDDVPGGQENYSHYPKDHTFYEDSNMYPHTSKAVLAAIQKELITVFGDDDYWSTDEDDIWGHIVEPGQQTTIHNHSHGYLRDSVSLSFAYYPNHPKNSGNIIFQTQVNTNQYQAEVVPRKGMAIIFDSEMWHHCPVNCSTYTRVSISGNVLATEKMIDILERDEKCENPYWKYSGKNDI